MRYGDLNALIAAPRVAEATTPWCCGMKLQVDKIRDEAVGSGKSEAE